MCRSIECAPQRTSVLCAALLLGVACGGGTDGKPVAPTTVPEPPPEAPEAPTGIRVTERGLDFIRWAWDPVEDATGYEVGVFPAGTPPDERNAPVYTEELSFRADELEPGSVGFSVRAVRQTAGGRAVSDWSDEFAAEVLGLEELIAPPAETGKVAAEGIDFTLVSTANEPLADIPYRWTSDEHSGWVFPERGRTDEDGVVTGTWIPGFPGFGKLTLHYSEGGEERIVEHNTLAVAPPRPPWSSVAAQVFTPLSTGFSIDMTPLEDPERTFYAVQWGIAGYAGLQRTGDLFDRQLQFSMWDEGGPAVVVEAAEGVDCDDFGGEGTGVRCRVDYPWSVGRTYRFEFTQADSRGISLVSLRVTDLTTGDERFIGTLAGHERMGDQFFLFNEDFVRDAPTCLDQPVRAVAYRRGRVRTTAMRWRPVVEARLDQEPRDFANPETPECANYDARPHRYGVALMMGGSTMRDPEASRRISIPQ